MVEANASDMPDAVPYPGRRRGDPAAGHEFCHQRMSVLFAIADLPFPRFVSIPLEFDS
ncbi:MAG: hypothetical protein JVY19_13380 [Ferrovum myxofaciens]|uniref:hypothetical protein n=1 Tax=Ferrovum myxofaciens TaxID=416213 RepID=UPI001C7505EA|nr:hypothetical protein [Ferrovum myxofaciens]QWY74766.1 MAG: hypothetical protein JVY19_13380 [Ferrovum myxofaciens]